MILVGQYDSPYVRRVAISLRELGFDYTHDTRSVFGDFDDMRKTNPLGRIPSLVLDDGDVLIDSGAILDWLDESVGPERALVPASGLPRRRMLQLVALACGAIDKAGASGYERLIRPASYRWPEWIARCRTQAAGAIASLSEVDWTRTGAMAGGAGQAGQITQAEISCVSMLRYVRMTDADLAPVGRYPSLDALAERCEARPAFIATYPPNIAYPTA
ncbi:glutathione S-transferase family protein [Dongia sp.]|uniref:glutathione S-transferase family protein n=1 Tax=Dongia sp. TaxID=1977262 RepID=UPI0035B1BE65